MLGEVNKAFQLASVLLFPFCPVATRVFSYLVFLEYFFVAVMLGETVTEMNQVFLLPRVQVISHL